MTGDGILTALHLASLVQATGCSLASLVDQSFQTYPQLLIANGECATRSPIGSGGSTGRNATRQTHVQQAIHEAEQAMGGEGRVLVRPSGTEPVIRVMVEAIDKLVWFRVFQAPV
jgi:phosphoglucosamine mutase